jgi:YspA, cpYpsA-related SLOG family
MTIERTETDYEQPHTTSPTDHVLTELQLHGYRPFQDEPDPRPLPEARIVAAAVADIFDALIASLSETRLEPDLEDLLWWTVNLFHRADERIERELDDNEQTQKRSQRDQDGSEIRSVELERLTAEGTTLIERRNSMEFFRDQAAEHFARHTGSHWHPRSGSMVNHRALTSAVIDSREFLAAKRRAETEVLLPAGPKIAFTGGHDCNDHRLLRDKLDQVHAKHPDMVLLHGGSLKGAERIAARLAK